MPREIGQLKGPVMTRRRWGQLTIGGLILAGILFGLGQWIGNWFWHPIAPCSVPAAQFAKCKGYNFWSGIGADVGEITLIVSLISGIIWFRTHYQCHEETCSKIGMHHVPGLRTGRAGITIRCCRSTSAGRCRWSASWPRTLRPPRATIR